MKIAPFQTEHFFARHEFNTPYQLCNSDCESLTTEELLMLAGQSLDGLGSLHLGYTESQGNPRLREAISRVYQSVSPEDVVVLATPVEGIYLAAHCLLEPDEEVIVLSPAYDALVNTFEHVVGKGRVHRWTFKPGADQWTLDLEELRQLITPQTRLLVVNFPHNPTGFVPTPDWLNELFKMVEQHDLKLFCDEMYFGLVNSGTPAIPSAADATNAAIVLSGLSKTHGLPGLRCGWLVVRDPALREQFMNWKFYTSICASGPSEYLSTVALRIWQVLRNRSLQQIEQNLQLATEFFSRWPQHFTFRRPQGGSTALVGYHVPSVSAIAETLARDEGILIQPAIIMGGDDQQMRIGLGRAGFGEALSRFEDWLTRQPA